MADRNVIYKTAAKEIADVAGESVDVHGQVRTSTTPGRAATSTPACGTPTAATSADGRRRPSTT